KLAELCASKPDRFAAFASLTLQAPDLAVQQLETAIKKQGLKGAAIGDRAGDLEFSDPKFHPVWAKAEELGVPLFIHPQAQPELSKRLAGNGWLSNAIGNPLGTTIALSHLIFEGTFDKLPGLKVIAAHGGGYLGSYADRSDHACLVGPKGCNPDIKLKKKPTEYLKQIYFDSLVFEPEAIRHLAAQVGASQIVLGSDYPYEWEMHPVDPPGNHPTIQYIDHQQGLPRMLQFFEGLKAEDLPDGQGWAVEQVSLSTHNGTHLDAPWHFHPTMNRGERSWTIDEVPLEWCFQPGVKLDFRHMPDGYVATAKDVENELRRIGHTLS